MMLAGEAKDKMTLLIAAGMQDESISGFILPTMKLSKRKADQSQD